jgi:hypothetical protein
VIALGDGEFEAVICKGGLPGDGWDRQKPRDRVQGKRDPEAGSVAFQYEEWTGVVADGKLTVTNADEPGKKAIFDRVERKSPTLGAKAPDGAIVLFDGTAESAEKNWVGGQVDGDLLCEGANTKEEFSNFTLHGEFLLPWKPKARGQARGNSGFYLTGRYETQVLDSFGLEGKNNECGGLYTIKEPDQNMCFPPLIWQTYDIEFTGAKFDDAGNKTDNARITVKHNGVVIHDDFELPHPTGAAKNKPESGPGSINLQNHANPVRYRNLWIVRKD